MVIGGLAWALIIKWLALVIEGLGLVAKNALFSFTGRFGYQTSLLFVRTHFSHDSRRLSNDTFWV